MSRHFGPQHTKNGYAAMGDNRAARMAAASKKK